MLEALSLRYEKWSMCNKYVLAQHGSYVYMLLVCFESMKMMMQYCEWCGILNSKEKVMYYVEIIKKLRKDCVIGGKDVNSYECISFYVCLS